MFENKTILILDDFITLQSAWERFRSPFRKLRKMQRICFALPGIILILMGGSNLWAALRQWDSDLAVLVFVSLLLIAFGILLIFWPVGRGMARRNWKNYPDKSKEQVYRFTEDQFSLQTDTGSFTSDYSDFQDIMEDKRIFLLFLNDQIAYVLHKDGFTSGDADSFRTFLTQRTGLTMRQL